MRCRCYVKETPTHGGKRMRKDVISWFHTIEEGLGAIHDELKEDYLNLRKVDDLLSEGYKVCDGMIAIEVAAVDEPYMGGCSAVLEVSYLCQSCGCSYFPELAETGEIGKFVTQLVADLDDNQTSSMRQAALQKEKDRLVQRKEMMQRFQEEREKQEKARKAKVAARKAKKCPPEK